MENRRLIFSYKLFVYCEIYYNQRTRKMTFFDIATEAEVSAPSTSDSFTTMALYKSTL